MRPRHQIRTSTDIGIDHDLRNAQEALREHNEERANLLATREEAVRRAQAAGWPNAAIARLLGISPRMVQQPAECGTMSGYQRHRRLGETPCDSCKAANAARDRKWRASQGQEQRDKNAARGLALQGCHEGSSNPNMTGRPGAIRPALASPLATPRSAWSEPDIRSSARRARAFPIPLELLTH